MKAIHVDGYGEKWLIEIIPAHSWNPCGPVVYRIDGTAQAYDTEADANEVIAKLKAQGEQGALDKYSKPNPPASVLDTPIPEAHPKPKRVKS